MTKQERNENAKREIARRKSDQKLRDEAWRGGESFSRPRPLRDRTDGDRLWEAGQAIREARVNRWGQIPDWTQAEFATAVGLDRSHISDIENGRVNISITTLFLIARTLGVEAARLVGALSHRRSDQTASYLSRNTKNGTMMTDSDRLRILGNRIRRRREARNWTQEKLATKANITRRHLLSIEHATKTARILTVFSIARALAIDSVLLMEGLCALRGDKSLFAERK